MAKIFKPAGRRGAKGRRPSTAGANTQQVELEILRLADDGRGVAQYRDKVVFVEQALPGERVQAQWLRRHKRFDEARVVQRLNDAAARVAPVCEYFGECGGCQLQHLEYPGQLRHKQQRLAGLLGDTALSVRVIQGEPLAYRHRARLSYRAGHLGFKSTASHHIVNIEHCAVLESVLERAVVDARPVLLRALKQSHSAELQFSLGSDGRVGLAIDDDRRRGDDWCEALAEALAPRVELHRVSSDGRHWQSDLAPLRYGDDEHSLAFLPADFTQANRQLNSALVAQCIAWLAPSAGEQLVDYFCGLGNFSLPLAASGASILAVDAGEEMLARARQRAEQLQLSVEFVKADLFDAAQIPLRQARKVLLDPPRAGARAVCEALAAAANVQRIVYVSCDPATLGRDVAILRGGGYILRDAVMADMFPQTHHMESLLLLERD
ncbi:methyltransferase domain-containing protein [Spongiibacter sp.]|uniref:methyltransferase domain-containing protein n=1 Tax=Spongiibacter sp. TaxID=2024860 RepID=UPI003563D5B8